MLPGLFVLSKGGGLFPANGRTQEALREFKLQPGDLVSASVIRSRNPKLCALAHAVIARLAEALGVPAETIKTKLKEAMGYVDLVQLPNGKVVRRPRSMSFTDLPDDDAFREFWRACEIVVCENILPALDDHEQAEILSIMSGRGDRNVRGQ